SRLGQQPVRGSPSTRLWVAGTGWAVGAEPWLVANPRRTILVGTAGAGNHPYETAMAGPSVWGFDAEHGERIWSYSSDLALLWGPDLGDLDGDRVLDTIVHERSGKLVGLSSVDGRVVLEHRPLGEFSHVAPRIADLDGDADPDVVYYEVAKQKKRLVAIDVRTKTNLWRLADDCVQRCYRVVIGDLGSDGSSEVVCGSSRDGVVVIDGRTGSIRGRLVPTKAVYAPPSIGDVTGDGAADLVVYRMNRPGADDPCGLIAFDGRSLAELWRSDAVASGAGTDSGSAGVSSDSEPLIADVDGDGRVEVITADYAGRVRVHRGGDGVEIWCSKVSEQGIFPAPRMADLDRDGRPEIVVGTKEHRACVLDALSGTVLRTIGTEAEVFGTALLVDVAGDPDLEIVIGDDDGRVHCMPFLSPRSR
ncbi:MAG: PQQ-like beta-propeller repeat protein, partial [Actinobacteria bacterium]|nr:PQQ-like beta-propeller repeat protein [Actinomycetota bacterium]